MTNDEWLKSEHLRFPVWKYLLSCIAGKVLKNVAFALAGYHGVEWIINIS
jgi:hypothetical protein